MAEIAKYYNRLGLSPVSADPASPSQGELQYSDGTHREEGLWRYNGTAWELLGGASGINHLEEAKEADSWTDDTNFTISENTTNPLRAPKDLLLSKAAVDASGELVSIPFSVDDADLAKVLPLTFEYKSDSAYADGDYEVEIYDVTNAAVISNSAPSILANELGNTHRTYFQTAVDSNSYELRIKCVTTSTTASSMQIDEVKCGPQNLAASQTIISDWVEYTPTFTGFGTVSNVEFRYARVGSVCKIQGRFQSGTITAVGARVSMPPGVSAENSSSGNRMIGWYGRSNIVQDKGGFCLVANGADTSDILFGAASTLSNATVNPLSSVVASSVTLNGEFVYINVEFEVPQWQTGTKPNEVISGREVSARLTDNSGQSIPDNTFTKVTWNTTSFDTTGSWDGTNNRFVAPESGTYKISAKISFNTLNWSTATNCQCAINLNGTQYSTTVDELDDTTGTNVTKTVQIDELIDMSKGDYVEIFAFQNSGNVEPLENSLNRNSFNIHKLNSASSQIAPTETVAAIYSTDSGQSVPNTTSVTILYEDKEVDTHNAYDSSTGEFTAPISGIYKVDATFRLDNEAVSPGEVKYFIFYKNGSVIHRSIDESNGTNGGESRSVVGSFATELLAGDTIRIDVYQNYGVTSSLITVVGDNRMSILKVGN